MNEEQFYRNHVRPVLERFGEHTRIENSISAGVFDLSYALPVNEVYGVHGWLELKVARGGKITFQRFQLPWARSRARITKGLGLWVLVTDGELIYLYNILDVLDAPKTIAKASDGKPLTVVALGSMKPTIYSQQPWPWERIVRVLAS